MKIYLDGLGERNANTEYEQIIWFLEQKAKTLSEAQRMSYFLSLKERFTPYLIKSESFELMAFLNKMVDYQQELQRKRSAARAKLLAALERRKRELERNRAIKKLIAHFSTPN